MKRPNIITRAALRGKPLFDFCKKAKTTNHECGKDDNRIFCYGFVQNVKRNWRKRND